MMMNKLPPNTTLNDVLAYLEKASKWGQRNRTVFAFRQHLRIKDIAGLQVSDVVNPDITIRRFYLSADGIRFELSDQLQAEVRRYLMARFCLAGASLEPLLGVDLNIALFPTQKSCQFSPNTLAQHFSYLDKDINLEFNKSQPIKKALLTQRLLKLSSSLSPQLIHLRYQSQTDPSEQS